MSEISRMCIAVALMATMASPMAQGQDKAAYERRSAARHVELFTWLDRDRDGTVTRLEVQGDLNFPPIFNDIDINRDGLVTKAELDRYIELRYTTLRP